MAADDSDASGPRRVERKRRPHTVASRLCSPPARAAFIILGTLGLAALAVAIISPRRARREILDSLCEAIEPYAEKAWSDAQPLRDQITALLERATPAGRKQLARDFQSWVGSFRASG